MIAPSARSLALNDAGKMRMTPAVSEQFELEMTEDEENKEVPVTSAHSMRRANRYSRACA